ncbi:MAG: hypothetical protein OEW08_05785 [Gammaproteobacteria bacterium]|nr:hypothetical protein [Gammaproteobacteria bacterium]
MSQKTHWVIIVACYLGINGGEAHSSDSLNFVQQYEALSIPTDGRPWVLARGAASNAPLVEYVLQGQSLQAWTSLLTVQYVAGQYNDRHVAQIVHATRQNLERDCPSLKWSDGLSAPNAVQYEWRHYGCQGFPAQHELVKIAKGRHGLFIMHYVEKALQLNPEVRNRWLMAFDNAFIAEFK